MNSIIKDSLILFAITIIAGALLGTTYAATKEPIAYQEKLENDIALSNVIADASFDSEIEIANSDLYESIENIYEAKIDGELVGYAFKAHSNSGYGGTISLVIGIDLDGKLTGIDITKHSETPGLGALADEDDFKTQYVNQEAKTLVVDKAASGDGIITALSGATITSNAVTGAVNTAIDYYNTEIKGGM